MYKLLLVFVLLSSTLSGYTQVVAKFDSLVWSDEFDGQGAIDSNKWFLQTQLPSVGSWFGGLVQHYTNRQENAFVEDGCLNLVAIKETFKDQGYTKEYTSARLNSKFAFTYGRVEIRAKMPFGIGTWPAIWLLNTNINEAGAYWETQGYGTTNWPNCGEIDIMEHWGKKQNYVSSALHNSSSYGHRVINTRGQNVENVSGEFHLYSMEWSEDKMSFCVDGVEHLVYQPDVQNKDTWPYDMPYYFILNIAIEPDIEPDFTRSSMLVDYIRVYQ